MKKGAPQKNPFRDVDWAEAAIDAVRGLSDPHQRVARLLELLEPHDPGEVALFLHGLSRAMMTREERLRRLHLELLSHRDLLSRLGYEKIAAIYERATVENWRDVKALFRADPRKGANTEVMPEGFAQQLRSLTLGERKALSRKMDRRKLEMLLFDADADVIRILLTNPKLIEKDVVRLACRNQAPTSVLEEVCKSKRWVQRYGVKKALVFNPGAPLSYAVGFLRHLTRADLKLLLQKGKVHPELAAGAKGLLEEENAL